MRVHFEVIKFKGRHKFIQAFISDLVEWIIVLDVMDVKSNLCLNTRLFYGDTEQSVSKVKDSPSSTKQPVPFKLRKLLGPCSLWKVFKKQADVLSFVNSRKCGLMSFVFQQDTGERLFLAAHPSWFWYHDSQKDVKSRSSYEIIPEFTVCKLYFDLEFSKEVNPFRDGVEMLDTFIRIVCFYLTKHFGIQCNRRNILDLDSSTYLKFSRHLIFQLPNAVFRDNYNAGNFVKYICRKIHLCTVNVSADREMQSSDFIHLMESCEIQEHQIKNLTVTNSKGGSTTFCDQGVYTKNRHFRLFKSSKIGKLSPLILSEQNQYKVNACEEEIFMDSLITLITNDADRLRILEFQGDAGNVDSNKVSGKIENLQHLQNIKTSPFPKIDRFIESVAHPGRIWRSFYFQSSNLIVYDIIGNRYCGNIRRHHKSNNIKLIVDLSNACYYQKCYDPDCVDYKSIPVTLPVEVQFHIDDELDCDLTLSDVLECEKVKDDYHSLLDDDDDNELLEILDTVEDIPIDNFLDAFETF